MIGRWAIGNAKRAWLAAIPGPARAEAVSPDFVAEENSR